MAGSLTFALVDVFAAAPLEGNPLAVVADADGLDDGLLRRMAREFNQSETTFLLRPTRVGADWRLRSFTAPGIEVFGAGHNALGAWWWLAATGRLGLTGPRTRFHQELGSTVLPVEIMADRIDGSWSATAVSMAQSPAHFGEVVRDASALAAGLGLPPSVLCTDGLPAQVVSTGAAHLLVPARDRRTVDSAQPVAAALLAVLQSVGGQGCYLFTLDAADATAYARFFNPTIGIWEDPATGSAAGPLGCYLARHARVAPGAPIRVAQGHAIGRPGVIEVWVGATVEIAGRGYIVAEGQLRH